MSTERFSFSTFLRDPKSVTAVLDRDDVLIERRDGGDFVLRSAERDARDRRAVGFLSWALAQSDVGEIAEVLAAAEGPFPWVRYLPAVDRAVFVRDVAGALRAAVELGSFGGVDLVVEQWRHSAEVWADPDLAEFLTAPVAEVPSRAVPRP